MAYSDSENGDSATRGSDKIRFAFERSGEIYLEEDFGWLIRYLNGELEDHMRYLAVLLIPLLAAVPLVAKPASPVAR